MVRLAISGYPNLKISDIELKRPSRSYTIDTLRTLKKESPEDSFYFIIGLDAFLDIESWKEPSSLLELVHFEVVSRPGFQFSQLTRLPFFSRIFDKELEELDLKSKNRLDLQINHFPTLILLQIDPYPISSSEIREKIKKEEFFNNNLLPEAVKSFIMKKRIFT
jgi:nicotinate-nucleotide adenylyltransferase